LLAAMAKVGKTTLLGNFLRSIVDGDKFLNEAEVEPLAEGEFVMLLDVELPPWRMPKWLSSQGIKRVDAVHLASLKDYEADFAINSVTKRRAWVKHLTALNCKILVVDCIWPLFGVMNLDENSDMGKFLTQVKSPCTGS
jgi:hypothetical protein